MYLITSTSIMQNDCAADHMVHGTVPVLRAASSARTGSHTARSVGRPALLCDSEVGGAAGTRAVDRRSHSDILRLQHRHRSPSCSWLLQQVPPQLLQVSRPTYLSRQIYTKICIPLNTIFPLKCLKHFRNNSLSMLQYSTYKKIKHISSMIYDIYCTPLEQISLDFTKSYIVSLAFRK